MRFMLHFTHTLHGCFIQRNREVGPVSAKLSYLEEHLLNRPKLAILVKYVRDVIYQAFVFTKHLSSCGVIATFLIPHLFVSEMSVWQCIVSVTFMLRMCTNGMALFRFSWKLRYFCIRTHLKFYIPNGLQDCILGTTKRIMQKTHARISLTWSTITL